MKNRFLYAESTEHDFLVTCMPCPHCHKSAQVHISRPQFRRLVCSNDYVQDIFPEWSAQDRELLISGMHPVCWTELFTPIDDDGEPPF